MGFSASSDGFLIALDLGKFLLDGVDEFMITVGSADLLIAAAAVNLAELLIKLLVYELIAAVAPIDAFAELLTVGFLLEKIRI